ncbi:NUDIX domain-containing protein [Candidatus Woesebacteria bacterium]|nr:NUDIX domain-containing protein [Candidatus Woesebacteria bacterium]
MDYSVYQGRQVVLVDENDNELGVEDILVAHQGVGKKHRALSVILYRRVGDRTEILMQKRSQAKPVFKGLWSNTCCTNLRPGDTYIERAVSRLKEEMGIEIKPEDLRILYRFSYEAPDLTNPVHSAHSTSSGQASSGSTSWCENEVDTVIVGMWDPSVHSTSSGQASSGQAGMKLNPDEAEDAKWMEYGEMKEDMDKNPDIYSPWHKLIINDPRFVEEVV